MNHAENASVKKQLAEIFRNYFYDPKKNKMRSKGATIAYIALYALLMVGLLGGMFALHGRGPVRSAGRGRVWTGCISCSWG